MSAGYLNLILHAHLPYIKHPGQSDYIEQRWFYEAVVESYIPLIDTLYRLLEKGKRFHLTLSVSPTLSIMLNDHDLKDGCETYLENLLELAEYECERNKYRPEILDLSRRYLLNLRNTLKLFTDKYKRNLTGALKELYNEGKISIITSAATHAFLPILEDYPEALHAQIEGGMTILYDIMNIRPKGFWLPECGYTPEIESSLKRSDVSCSILESHGIILSNPFPSAGVYSPVLGPAGVVLFGRDSVASQLVWSSESGYPADTHYRDFYDDIVYELPEDAVKKYIHPDGIRIPSGIKYRRITHKKKKKKIYDPRKANRRLAIHASHFMNEISNIICRAKNTLKNVDPVVSVAFDAELFGHWWHEGCGWLERILSGFSDSQAVGMMDCNNFLQYSEKLERVTPERSSWGHKGFSETWINPRNDWMIKYICQATEVMIELASTFNNTLNKRIIKALNMAAREVLLIQSSDWGFLMSRGTSDTYVRKRFLNHFQRLEHIANMVRMNEINEEYLLEIERQNGRFVETDFRRFAKLQSISSDSSCKTV